MANELHSMSDDALVLAAESATYRYKYLRLMSVLGLFTSLYLAVLFKQWGLGIVSTGCAIYSAYCGVAFWVTFKAPWLSGRIAETGVFFTWMLIMLGIVFAADGVYVEPWLAVLPVIAHALCSKNVSVIWSAIAAASLLGIHFFLPNHYSLASTLLLVSAILSTAIILYAVAVHNEKVDALIVRLGNTDSLTKVLNRRTFDDLLKSEFRRNLRSSTPMTVFMIDVDWFKSYNDSLGHVEGDKALAAVAHALKEAVLRSSDSIFRYGGEEFCILCSGLNTAQSAQLAEKLRASVAALAIPHQLSPMGRITVSIGYHCAEKLKSETPEVMVQHADQALYLAKDNGRNRVEQYSPAVARTLPVPSLAD